MTPEMVAGQLAALLEEVTPGAIKVGMVGRSDVVEVLVRDLAPLNVPLVVDPVLAASGGEPLCEDGGLALEALLSHATLITPNLGELSQIGGVDRWLEEGVAVLLKGGHGEGSTLCDQLYLPGGRRCDFEHPRQQRSPHGTGCALSASITARLARGEELVEATGQAIAWLQARIARARPLSSSSVGWALLADSGGALKD
jgi:hydroxymethylpyrimidine/phosphomethylpyrimidine kinase